MLGADAIRARGGRGARRPRLHRPAAVLAPRRARGALRRRNGVLHAGVRRDRARPAPVRRPARSERARPGRAADRAPAGRPRPRRRARGGGRRRGLCRRRCVLRRLLPLRSSSCDRRARPPREVPESAVAAIKEGVRFVRGRVWLWGTLLSATFAYLAFMGPTEVLLPYVVKNELHASAGDLGLVFAAGRSRRRRRRSPDGAAGAPAPRRHLHVRRLDARDAGRRRLRARHGVLAADARLPASSTRSRRRARSSGRPSSNATSPPRCSVGCRASTG